MCPIWDTEIFPEYESYFANSVYPVGCYPNLEAEYNQIFTYSRNPWNLNDGAYDLMYNDLLDYINRFNPINTMIIDSGLQNGYENTIFLPYDCRETKEVKKRINCIIKECSYIVDSNIQDCCARIGDKYYHTRDTSFEFDPTIFKIPGTEITAQEALESYCPNGILLK